MALPHFHTMPTIIDPIFSSLYDGIFITNDGVKFSANIERFEICDDILTCRIQDYPESNISNIKKSVVLLIEYFDKVGNIIKINIMGLKIKGYKSEFAWDSEKTSHIDASFDIINYKSLYGNDVSKYNRDALIKSIIRDKKLTQLLD